VKVKICGNTNLEDAERAADLGAWALGLIFYERSRRRCGTDEATRIAAALRRRVELCGVFVNASLDRVASVADEVGLTMIQLHGEEGPAYCAEAARRTGARVVKAMRVRSRADLQALDAFHTDFHLLDSRPPGPRAQPGQPFDWSLARGHRGHAPAILSGGLVAENVAEGISTVQPFAVDVASGVEAAPGRKDPTRLEAFFAAVAGAGEVAAPEAEPVS
jgi:phosphoribosylanthranilate isomerase